MSNPRPLDDSAHAGVMGLPLPLVIATGNADKAREIVEVLVEEVDRPLVALATECGFVLDTPDRIATTSAGMCVPGQPLDVEETGATLEANARIKARAHADALGLVAIADDTGLEVDALDGAPGVRSARFAGADASYGENVELLLAELEGVYPALRTARFTTVVIARWPEGREVVASGAVEGLIAPSPHGARGFGYDPVFVPVEGDGRSFAEMTPSEKHALSHRGRALRVLASALNDERGA
ncbi:MAG: non-canonical purine NTP pyrophosphatase [Actinomycetota bacterium]